MLHFEVLDISFPFGEMPSMYVKYLKHHYYAGKSFVGISLSPGNA